jgi:hypothetical protein
MKIKKDSVVKEILQATYPDYKGRKFFLNTSGKVSLDNTNWCEGSRVAYKFIRLTETIETGRPLPQVAPWNNPFEGKEIVLPADCACVTERIAYGRECGITIYINPINAVKFIENTPCQ